MKKLGVVGMMLLTAVCMAAATERSAEEVMRHHVDALQKGDVGMLLEDYADNAVVIASGGSFYGTARVREYMISLSKRVDIFRDIQTSRKEIGPGVVVQDYTIRPGTLQERKGVDVFVIREGKIVFQGPQPMG